MIPSVRVLTLAVLAVAAVVVPAGALAAPPRVFTVAGGVGGGITGDGQLATRATLEDLREIAALPDGGFVLIDADVDGSRVRRVGPDGVIRTVRRGFEGPSGIAALPGGGFLVADRLALRVFRVGADGAVSTFAGGGPLPSRWPSDYGDGGPATKAFIEPTDVAVQPDGGVLVTQGSTVRRIGTDGIITTVAGDPSFAPIAPPGPTPASWPGYDPRDGGPALTARFCKLTGVTALRDGGYLLADEEMHRIRRVDARGIVHTVAGIDKNPCGSQKSGGFSGDGGAAVNARLRRPTDATVDADGSVIIADSGNRRVRRVAANGLISTIAGRNKFGGLSRAEGELGTDFSLTPLSLAALPRGGILVRSFGFVYLLTTAGDSRPLVGLGMPTDEMRAFPSRLTARVRVSTGSRVELQIRRGRERIATAKRRLGSLASTRFSFHRWLTPGIYTVTATATTPRGYRTVAGRRLVLGGRLTIPVVRAALTEFGVIGREEDASGHTWEARSGPCRVLGSRRVDCRIDASANGRRFSCSHINAVRLARTGQVHTRPYAFRACAFQRSPRWQAGQPWTHHLFRWP